MAEGTRLHVLDETVSNHSTQLATLSEQLSALLTVVTSFDGKLEQLRLSEPSIQYDVSSSTPPTAPHPFQLDFPRFDGSDPLSWLFKATQNFDFHHTPPPQSLQIISFHMDVPALAWYQWMHSNNHFHSWDTFAAALEVRFGDFPYVDHMGSLAKLRQTSIVTAYITSYEALANRTSHLQATFLLSNFISGLRPDIRPEVQALHPSSITQAYGLAKLQEDKFLDAHRPLLPRSIQPTTHPPSAPPLLPSPAAPIPAIVCRLSINEMRSPRERRLCFNCNENFHHGHQCKTPSTLFLLEDDSPPAPLDPDPELLVTDASSASIIDPPPDISLHALAGQPSPLTLRISGRILHLPVQILNDSGSTHNFIQDRLAEHL